MNGRVRTVGECGALRAGHWRLDPDRCESRFRVRQLGLLPVSGTAPVLEGGIDLGPDGRILSGRVVVALAALATGNPRRDRDLRGPRWLDTRRQPLLVAVVRSGEPQGDGWRLRTAITARGATDEIELTATVAHSARDSAVVHVTGWLDLRALGLRLPGLVVARRVAVLATLVAGRS